MSGEGKNGREGDSSSAQGRYSMSITKLEPVRERRKNLAGPGEAKTPGKTSVGS